ncbi:nucleotide exchange factor GrpE [Marinihelvus fidelis]|uniref:Protein GrpE n=1 Tax=Marinihelvus fidelis TaxID=2613842 RepID=A0A5N0TE04_9GAMM|nr:nucleotide exchange factor GrpE [Marinihelvus fidelis]KAA9133210.1 nucleotide exchange factor GrpE [Marinihelvus fidelis]
MTPEHDPKSAGEEAVDDAIEAACEAVKAGEEASEAAEAGDETTQLQDQLADAEQKVADARDAMLRMQAEMDNLRKRLVNDLERSKKRALEGFMSDLVPVRDSLEKGLEAAEESASVESLKEGKALIKRMLDKAMADHGLVEINPVGETFNPEEHEAISMIPSPEHETNTVIDVVQKGFRLNERLIRPARVVVSSGAPDA